MAIEKRYPVPSNRTISLLGYGHMSVKTTGATPSDATLADLKPMVKEGRWDEVVGYLKMLRMNETGEFYALHHFLIRKIGRVGYAWLKIPGAYYMEALCRVVSHMPMEMLRGQKPELEKIPSYESYDGGFTDR